MNRTLIAAVAAGALFATGAAHAEIQVKIGVLTDMSGVYADLAGPGSLLAAKMAVEDFNPAAKGMRVDIVSADHQNKPDIGSNLAGSWYDTEKVDVIVDLPTSSVSLAVAEVGHQKNKVVLVSGGAAEGLTGPSCHPTTVHWTYDTYSMSRGIAKAIVKNGGDTWFFLTGDFAAGHALEKETSAVVTASGGKVVGGVRTPLNTADFSSFLIQAQASKAKILGVAVTGQDLVTSVKQASEFGIRQGGQSMATLIAFISDIHGLGLQAAQGLELLTAFYWDRDDKTRAFAKRFAAGLNGKHPTMVHAGVYSSVMNYLEAVKTVGSAADGAKVVDEMKRKEINDPLFGKVRIGKNGRAFHDMLLVKVKSPAESKGPWDYYKIAAVLPGDQAFRPVQESGCPLVK